MARLSNSFLNEERRINLSSVKKIDPHIEDILDKTDKVAYYTFDGTNWHKKDIEGSMFVFSRAEHPYYGFIIQNSRRFLDNVCEYLVDGIEFQRTDLFLLYKTSNMTDNTGIRSIWFGHEQDIQRISILLNKLLEKRHEPPKPLPLPQTDGDSKIFKLLQNARTNYEQNTKMAGGSRKNCGKRRNNEYNAQQHESNMLTLFQDAHNRYNEVKCQGKKASAKRPNSNVSNTETIESGASQVDTESTAVQSLKSITFQDLVDSVNKISLGEDDTSNSAQDNTSSSELDAFDDYKPKQQKDFNNDLSPTISSESDPISNPAVTNTLAYSNKIMLSPYDFTTPPSSAMTDFTSRCDEAPRHSASKRSLFGNRSSPSNSGQHLDTGNQSHDLQRFKQVLIDIIQEDDRFVERLYRMFHNRTTHGDKTISLRPK